MAEPSPEPLELFPWMELLALATGRKLVTQQANAIAMFVALSSKGTTGRDATIKAPRLSIELGISERQVWRYFKKLCDDGWLVRTSAPTRGEGGGKGRIARYRLTYPRVFVSHDMGSNRLTDRGVGVSHDQAGTTESSDTLGVNRLTLSAESSDIAERENGTVTPTYGSPTYGSPSGHPSALTTDRARANDVTWMNGRWRCRACEAPKPPGSECHACSSKASA